MAVTSAPATTAAATRGVPQPRKLTTGEKIKQFLPYVGVALIIIYCLIPFYWMVVSAFRRSSDTFSNSLIPAPISVENFAAAFDPKNYFTQSLFNSLIVAGVTTVLVLLIGTLASYALARLNFRFKNLALWIIVTTSMFPGISMIVPLFKLFTDWSWINSYHSMIIPYLSFGLPLAVWNLTTFFRQMPYELEEAAQIDGCTPGQAFRRVILPLAAPGVFTTAIIVFITSWNEYIIAASMVNEQGMKTAPVIVSQFTGATNFDTPFGTKMAAGVIVTIPLVLMVLFFQRRIVAGLTAGGVK